jgi:MATE family multidrug resistance protein
MGQQSDIVMDSLARSRNGIRPGGYREVLAIALPLVVSTSSTSLMHFVDRMFLSWYSADALAASLAAGVTWFMFASFFLGTASYVSTFVSQYDGAGRPQRIGAALWQGLHFCLIGTVCMASLSFAAEPLFRFVGHAPGVQREEMVYFRVMALGGGGAIFNAALAGFFSGRGRTRAIMYINFSGAVLNALLDYCWIFGKAGFPRTGIFGAAAATVLATWVQVIAYLVIVFLPHHRRDYSTASAWRPERDLFSRLLRYGLPNGLQFMVDVFAFTVFVLFVGRIGKAELAASTVAFSINSLIFVPMLGLAMATTVLVGRHLGANCPDNAARATATSARLTLLYMGSFSLVLALWPDVFLSVFRPADAAASFAEIAGIGRNLLYFVAAYSLLDGLNITYSAALKGAGDTRYVLWMLVVMATTGLIVPVYVACVLYGAGIYTAWVFLTIYVVALALAYWWRYRAGHWRSMRVIEHVPLPATTFVEGPVVEAQG